MNDSITLAGHTWYRDDLHRAALTRALTAQAWAVACALYSTRRNGWRLSEGIENAADLPAPADIAEEMLR